MYASSTTPSFIRGMYEWCVDNGLTTLINVIVNAETDVPAHFVKDGEITLNIGVNATKNLIIGNETVEFSARSNGTPRTLSIPIHRIQSIFARETAQGMGFEVLDKSPTPPSAQTEEASKSSAATPASTPTEKKPTGLRIIK